MTRNPLYINNNAPANPNADSHKGLWYERFFNQYDENKWEVKKLDKKNPADKDGKQIWIETVKGKCGDEITLKTATEMQTELCCALSGKVIVRQTDWHFATGLGNPHPVENGFAWHPTLGVPYLTGAAVKGLVRAWMEEWEEFANQNEKKKKLHNWFGSEDKDPTKCELDSQSGNFIFFDALPIAPVTLKPDVMTPHMGKWYDEGGELPKQDGSNIPADWHSPVPVYFLVADKPQLLFVVAPRTDVAKAELDDVMKALGQALEWLGAGAKTAVGYGRMTENENANKKLEDMIAGQKEELRKKEIALQKKREMENMPPFEREIAEILLNKQDQTIKDYVMLLKKLEENHWTDTDTKNLIAQKIKGLMKTDKVWKETSHAKKPEKDKDFQRTLKVLKYLNQQ